MTIIDSSVLIDYLAGTETPEVEWLERHAGILPCGVTDLIVYEVLRGIREEKQLSEVRAKLEAFARYATMLPGMEVKAASNYRSLRRRGITIRATVDTLVATFCIERGHDLLHRDRDFEPFAQYLGLKVVSARTSVGIAAGADR